MAATAAVQTPRPLSRTGSERVVLRRGPLLLGAGIDDLTTVLRAGALVAGALAREVIVVSVVEPAQQFDWQPGLGAFPREGGDALLEARRRRIAEEVAATRGALRWSVRSELGGPAQALARVAREVEAPALIVGIGRHRPLDRLLGSETALKTVRYAECPVLAVSRGFTHLPRVVVVGIDFSEASRRAVESLLPIIAPDATLHLVHVWQPSDRADAAHVEGDEAYRNVVPERMQQLIESLHIPHGMTVKHELREGKPADRLLDFANAHHADLVAVGKHGQGFFERFLVGSVATHVLRGAGCSVFVAPEPRLHERARPPLPGTSVSPDLWKEQLDVFSRRNSGRLTLLEMGGASRVPASREMGYVLFGVSYREPEKEIEIILGEANGRRRHLTSVIPNADAVTLIHDEAGADVSLRIDHQGEQALLTLLPAPEISRADDPNAALRSGQRPRA